jgi:periplasmic protein TonB
MNAGHSCFVSMRTSLVLSFALHVILLSSWMVYKNYHPYKPEERERLTVEINGIVTNKQIEERQAVQEAPTPPPQVAEKEPEKDEPKKPKTPPIEKKKVLAKSEEATHKMEPELQKEAVRPVAPSVAPQNMDAQKQQTTANHQDEAAVMQRYARAFKKKLHEHVVFPSEAKGKGYMGVPKVGFIINEDGSVPKESIKIIKSSGYDVLDQKAIVAVLESTPFERPPRAFNAEVDIDFSTHQ